MSESTAAEVFAAAPWRSLDPATLGPAAAVPSMLEPEERLHYLWLAADWARGMGAIIDLGSFVGGSAACFAQGLVRAGRDGRVHLFDRFRASEATKARFLYPAGIPPFPGTDTLPLVRRLMAPWQDRTSINAGDLADQRWRGGAVEVLAVDVAKSADLADHVAAEFYPALIPGHSVVVQQDFLHDMQPWLPAQAELFADFLTPLARVARDCVTFLCTAAIAPADVAARRMADRDDAALLALLQASRGRPLWKDAAHRLDRMAARTRLNPGVRSTAGLRRGQRPGNG